MTNEHRTAATRIMETLSELSDPGDEAGSLELAFGTVAMMLQRALPDAINEMQEAGELDDVILGLTRWFASHRGDDALRLVVVELPRRHDLPAATKLKQIDAAEAVDIPAGLPL